MPKLLQHTLIILSIIGLVLPPMASLASGGPIFVFAQNANQSSTQPQPPEIPETWDEIWIIAKKALNFFPQTLKVIWQEAVGIWQKVTNFFKKIWNSYIWPKIEWIWQRVLGLFGKEVEKRKEAIPKELEKEKKELKEELQEQASKTGKSFWERLKDIIWRK